MSNSLGLNEIEERFLQLLSEDNSQEETCDMLDISYHSGTHLRLVRSVLEITGCNTMVGAVAVFLRNTYNVQIIRHTNADLDQLIRNKHPRSGMVGRPFNESAYDRVRRFEEGETIGAIYGGLVPDELIKEVNEDE